MTGLKGKSALVTGGAGGIGSEVCRRFVHEGMRVAIADISEERAVLLKDELEALGGTAVVMLVDLHSEESIKTMIERTSTAFGRLDVLINCAMETKQEISATDIDVLTMNVDAWKAMFEVNLYAGALACKYAIPGMIANGGGAIVNFASTAGMLGEPTENGYGCTKAAVIQLTRSIATTYGKRGVRCNSISPGLIRHSRIDAALPSGVIDIVMDNQLVPYPSEPKHISGVAAFLVSDDAAFITGQNIVVDGGTNIHTPILAQQVALFANGFDIAKND